MKNAFARLVRGILLVLGGIFLGVNGYLAVVQGILHDPLPMPFGYGTAVVLSGSMEPALHVDDLLVIRQTREVGPGDIIVYQDGAHLVVHRVVYAEGQTVVTRGDANNVNDDPITIDAVRGVVIQSHPGGGAWFRAFRSPAGMLVIMLLVFLLFELTYSLGRKGEGKRQVEAMKEEIRQLRAMSEEDGKEGKDEP